MLHPLIVDPDYLIKCIENDEELKKIKELLLEFKSHWEDLFILIDDKEENLLTKYKKILSEYGHQNPELKIILDYLTKSQKTKRVNLNKKFKSFSDIKNFLISKEVNNIVEIPNYFTKNFINKKECTGDSFLIEMKYSDLIDKITSITRFSKKVYLIDPMIPYHLTNINLQYGYQHQNFVSNIKNMSTDSENLYVHSLNILIKKIYETNFFKEDLKICIMTTIEHSKIKHFFSNIINEINKWTAFNKAKRERKDHFIIYKKNKKEDIYSTLVVNGKKVSLLQKKTNETNEEFEIRILKGKCLKTINEHEILKEIKNWQLIGEFIEKCIMQCTQHENANVVPVFVDVRDHHPDKIMDKTKPKDTIYRRSIVADDLDCSLQVRKGLDLFQADSPNKLRYDEEYIIRLNCSPQEKERSRAIVKRPKFEAKKIIYN